MNKGMIKDFAKFSLLEKFICGIDLLLNPTTCEYPIIIGEIPNKKTEPYEFDRFKRETGHLLTVRNKNNRVLYLRCK